VKTDFDFWYLGTQVAARKMKNRSKRSKMASKRKTFCPYVGIQKIISFNLAQFRDMKFSMIFSIYEILMKNRNYQKLILKNINKIKYLENRYSGEILQKYAISSAQHMTKS
jgi:hypothetical protein